MHDTKRIDVMENIMDENDHIAEHVREHLSENSVLCVNEMGAPGAGKTSCIERLSEELSGLAVRSYAIEGDIESDIDTKTLRARGIKTMQINTFGACHLDAPMVHNMVHNMEFDESGVLFIENVGNLVCPAEFTIGEHLLMLICTVTEGSDKPYKYPLAFEKADLVLLNKTDLLPYVDFDEEFFMRGLRALNKKAPLFKVSAKKGEGFSEAAAFLAEKAAELR